MKGIWSLPLVPILLGVAVVSAGAATIVPNEIQQPGTQPNEVGNLESPDKCDNCHGGYDSAVEPAFNWRGSMMANAGRDPIFWSTLAIAEQDFDGSGDLCIRCHSTGGWYAGHSTPTDGSGLAAGDADGVDCDTCHKMTNPNGAELAGVMNSPFIANDQQTPATGYYGSGMLSLSGGNAKLGPYADAVPKHQFAQSLFHRDVSFCGSCHDVSNPAVGDLAHNNGKQDSADPVIASGVLGSALDAKAAFNNFPYQYGIVERTYSEYYAGALSKTLVSAYPDLPADLKAGAVQAAYLSSGGDYEDGTPRYFSCQTCHMSATTGVGANKAGTPTRTDLPLHDLTGGNYWMPDAIVYQNAAGTLRLGGGLSATQLDALDAGKSRASEQLRLAAALSVDGNTLKVTNLTGHKLISGYPEGRRMWLNIRWYDSSESLLREDGAYGPMSVTLDGSSTTVDTILNLEDPNTKMYEAHYGMTQEWAAQLIALGYPSGMVLSYDRLTGLPDYTLGDLAAQTAGTSHETFHFVLNNTVATDDRIPPYGFDQEEARKRNALPVPSTQYQNPDGSYRYWDDFSLNPPSGAVSGEIRLMYQPTSWEYIQFLYLANDGSDAFLADEGDNLLDAWMNTGMAEPFEMASATWGSPPSVVSISGNVGLEGVSLGYEDGGAKSVTSAANGDYSLAVPSGWSGTVTPGKLGYSFTPVSRSYTNVTTDQAGQDYSPTQLEYTLTITSAHGTVTKSPDQATYHYGDVVQLTAAPDAGWSFASWSGDLVGTTNPDSVTIEGNTSVTANYSQIEYTLTITSAHGTVTKNPDQATYHYGDVVELTAAPYAGWSFASWSGDLVGTTNPDSVTIEANTSVTANYSQIEYTLTITSAHGTVTKNPDQATYHYGDAVQLTAASYTGWSFASWSGDLVGTTNPDSVTIEGNASVTANYSQIEYTLTITSAHGTVTKNPDQTTYHYGDLVQLTAAPDPGWIFMDWSGDLISTSNPDSLTIHGNSYVTAGYAQLTTERTPSDFDGDGKTDPAKYVSSAGAVYYLQSSTGTWASVFLNTDGAYVLNSDFDGDRRTDPAKYVSSTGAVWYLGSIDAVWHGVYIGSDGTYIPASDFDGDGKTDPAKYVASAGALWYLGSADAGWHGVYIGSLGTGGSYVPGADFDGDGKTDPAKYVSGGVYYLQSSTGTWGSQYIGSDGPYVPRSDFDGDGLTDPAKFVGGSIWYLQSSDHTLQAVSIDADGTPVPGPDFDGDGKTDPAKLVEAAGSIWYRESGSGLGWVGVYMGSGSYDIVN